MESRGVLMITFTVQILSLRFNFVTLTFLLCFGSCRGALQHKYQFSVFRC